MYAEKPLLHQRQKNHLRGQLKTVTLDVTGDCNMKCHHCYNEAFKKTDPLELPILLRTLEEFYQLGIFHYVLMGGEPTMVPERLEAILKGCRPDECYINLISNGYLLDRPMIAWLKGLQVDKISLSLDSGLPHEHDASRRAGSFQRVVQAVAAIREAGLVVSIITVVTHDSLYSEGFQRALAYSQQQQIRLDVQIAEPVGKWEGETSRLITPEDAAYIKSLQQQCGRLATTGQYAIHRDIFHDDFDHCPAGTENLSLTVDGELLPCNFLQYSLGNVRHKSVAQMRQSLLTSPWFNGRQPCCIIGEDPRFIEQFVTPYVGQPKPLDGTRVFGLPPVADTYPPS